jgi:hypothetical protein
MEFLEIGTVMQERIEFLEISKCCKGEYGIS